MGPHCAERYSMDGTDSATSSSYSGIESIWLSDSDFNSLSNAKQFKCRPPVYNSEDYASFLKKWSGPDTEDGDAITSPSDGEMSLRQFSSVADLLDKLKNDLKCSYSSFVREFVSEPINGVSLLLELLRSVQAIRNGGTSERRLGIPVALQRRALLDESSCLLCLKYCTRAQDALRILVDASAALYTITSCIMSSLLKSRITALEILCKVSTFQGNVGHTAVSEALSTMRLKFGEPVRFKFLVGIISGGVSSNTELLLAGLRFINTFVKSAPTRQMQIYIQAELNQAVFDAKSIKMNLNPNKPFYELILAELQLWNNIYIDLDELERNYRNKCEDVKKLKENIILLESKLDNAMKEKQTWVSNSKLLKDRCAKLKNQMSTDFAENKNKSDSRRRTEGEGNSTPTAEDEGISSSEQDDLSPRSSNGFLYEKKLDNLTIDDVLKDFKDIIQTEERSVNSFEKVPTVFSSENDHDDNVILRSRFARTSFISPYLRDTGAIIPSKIVPEPPRKSRSLFFFEKFNSKRFFDEEENFAHSCSSIESRDLPESNLSKPNPIIKSTYYFGQNMKDFKPNGIRRSETFHEVSTKFNDDYKTKVKDEFSKFEELSPKFHEKMNAQQRFKKLFSDGKQNFESPRIQSPRTSVSALSNTSTSISSPQNSSNRFINRQPTKSSSKLSRSCSTKAIYNTIKSSKYLGFSKSSDKFTKSNSGNFSKYNDCSVSTSYLPEFSLKLKNNAGLYSGENQTDPNLRKYPMYANGFETKTSRFDNNSKQISRRAKLMDTLSGLY